MPRPRSWTFEGLVLKHRTLAGQIARRWFRQAACEADRDDLVSAAHEGLIQAALAYDGRVDFPAYAEKRIAGAVRDHLRLTDPMSRDMRRHRNELGRAGDALYGALGRAPTVAELAAHLGLSVEQVESLRRKAMCPEFVDLHGSIPTMRGKTIHYSEVLPANDPRPDDVVAAKLDALEATIGLGERLLLVLRKRFVEDLSLKEIGADLGVTESRACQLVKDAIRFVANDMAAA
jgi:RNA polymerase sigma factor for flagellar operon FliA